MVVTAAELEPPCAISDEDFDDLCFTHRIEYGKRDALRQQLDQIINDSAEVIREEQDRPDRQLSL